jgi:hypothetical protein
MDLIIDEDDGRWNIVIIQKSLAIRVPSKCGTGSVCLLERLLVRACFACIVVETEAKVWTDGRRTKTVNSKNTAK